MYLKLEENMSSLREVTSRVSQGSVLGPILFLYVNYIATSVNCTLKSFTELVPHFSFPKGYLCFYFAGADAIAKDFKQGMLSCKIFESKVKN